MNLGSRSRLSICQLLQVLSRSELDFLLEKNGFPTAAIADSWHTELPSFLKDSILSATASQLDRLVDELARKMCSLRSGVTPRYRFDEQWDDLTLCLELDGYIREKDEGGVELPRFIPVHPVIEGTATVEDDLTKELWKSDLSETEEIIRTLSKSANAFLRHDFNGCLSNSRVALQTLATAIARVRLGANVASIDITKWGKVIAYLRTSNFLTVEQEKGLAGVYTFVSPGSHTPIGFDDQEFARLGRNMTLLFCYFLVKRQNAPSE